MEKFGIFELLDALSALTAHETTPENITPSQNDAAYQPPAYGNFEPPQSAAQGTQGQTAQPQEGTPSEPRVESDALAGFYARHNAIAKKANGKK